MTDVTNNQITPTTGTIPGSNSSKASRDTDYLTILDNTPPGEQYPLVHQWMKEQPLAFFKQLREQRPILVTEHCTLIANFTDIRDMLSMPLIFTVDLYKPKMGVTDKDEGYLMAHDDDALHYREKSLMQGFLNRDDLPCVRALIADTAKSILEKADGEIEIVNDYCRAVPAALVQDYFGLDGVDSKTLVEWSYWNQYDAFHNQPFDLLSEEQSKHIVDEHDKVSEQLVKYIAKLMARKLLKVKVEKLLSIPLWIARRIKQLLCRLSGEEYTPPRDDIVCRMLRSPMASEVDFSLIRVGVNAGGLLIGSIETTSQAVSQSIQYFLNRPELLEIAQLAAKDENPAHFDSLVWESLRFVPISPYVFRRTACEYTLAKGRDHETTIPANTNVLALTQSAMFDDYAFERPEQFNSSRNWYHHFNFGFGSHECLGKYVGMVMIPEMVRQVLLRRKISSRDQIDYKDGPFPERYNLHWSALY